jgi:hypothetical protein
MLLVECYIFGGEICPRIIPIWTNKRKHLWTNPSRSPIGVVARVGEFQPIFDNLFVPNEASAKDPIPTVETREMGGNVPDLSFVRPVRHVEPVADRRTLRNLLCINNHLRELKINRTHDQQILDGRINSRLPGTDEGLVICVGQPRVLDQVLKVAIATSSPGNV